MRNMSFFLTTPQFRDRSKTVTRRCGWKHARAGDIVQGVVKGQGIPKGEKIEKLGPIELINVRREPLNVMTPDDCAREGFPDMTVEQFIAMFCKANKCPPDKIITRIEYKYL